MIESIWISKIRLVITTIDENNFFVFLKRVPIRKTKVIIRAMVNMYMTVLCQMLFVLPFGLFL